MNSERLFFNGSEGVPGLDYVGLMDVEGAWNEGNRGPSIWDDFTHTEGGLGTKVNEEGINYYNNLINALLKRDKAASEWLYVIPWGIKKTLVYISQRYHNPLIYVTENGMDGEDDDTTELHEMLEDKMRLNYFKEYVAGVA